MATGFNRNHVINSEGGIIDEEYRVEYVADRVRTMSLAWLGLTLECARCHDHKFDPVPQRDYYRMFAFFNSVDETGEDGRVGNAAPLMRAPTREQQRRYDDLLNAELAIESRLIDQFALDPPPAELPTRSRPPSARQAVEKQVALSAADEPLALPAKAPLVAPLQPFDCGGGWAMFAWVKRDSAKASPLFSTMDFSAPPSAQGYGAGMQVGVADDGAIDVRLAKRWPAYALNIRSVESLPLNQWTHVAVVGRGNQSEGFRLFIDGVEGETTVRHDDLTGSVNVGGTASIGSAGDGAYFSGQVFRLHLLSGEFGAQQLDALLADEMLAEPAAAISADESWRRRIARSIAHPQSSATPWRALYDQWRQAREDRLAYLRTFPTLMVVRDVSESRQTFVLERGQYDKRGEPVSPGVPSAIGLPLPTGIPHDRVALARWLTDPRQPLTARVVVNRFWQCLFGVGLVKTVEDFGLQSEWPSHPELLDWLSAEFMTSGWDVKRLLTLIVSSATYQQDSSATAQAWASDPENRRLSRGPRQRLTAEMIRDQALAVSGLLVPKLGGPPVFPYQPAGLYENMIPQADYPGTVYVESKGEDLYRRSLYTFWKRTVPHPTLSTFDAPDREFCTARRSVTTTPLQALVLMNDPTFLEAARHLGARMLREGGSSDRERLAWGFQLLTSRPPSDEELATLVDLLVQQRREFAGPGGAPKGLLAVGASPAAESHDADAAAYASAASLLLNLDEALTRN